MNNPISSRTSTLPTSKHNLNNYSSFRDWINPTKKKTILTICTQCTQVKETLAICMNIYACIDPDGTGLAGTSSRDVRRRMRLMRPNSTTPRLLVPPTPSSFLDPAIVLFQHLLYVVRWSEERAREMDLSLLLAVPVLAKGETNKTRNENGRGSG